MRDTQNMKPVPILMLNWNGISDTNLSIESLQKMKFQNWRLFLLDNGSDNDEGLKLVEKYSGSYQIRVILSNDNLGFTKGNIALYEELIRSGLDFDYLVLLNNDTEVEHFWLTELIEAAMLQNADMVSSKMINFFDHKQMDNAGHKMINTAEIVPIGFQESSENFENAFENFGPCAGACLYSKKMIDCIGFFDPYFETGYEDAELGARAIVSGYKSFYAPKAKVYHKISQSVNKILDFDYILTIQKNIFYSYFKLMPLPVILLSIPSFIIKYLFVFIVDILFWRPKYLKIHFLSFRMIFKNWPQIREARNAFMKGGNKISSFRILFKQQFFLWFDAKRFFKFVLFRKKSEFDKVINTRKERRGA